MGAPFNELVATVDRQLALRGPVAHAEGGLWASRIEEVDVVARSRRLDRLSRTC